MRGYFKSLCDVFYRSRRMLKKKFVLALFALFCVFSSELRHVYADRAEKAVFFNDFGMGIDSVLMFEENSIGKGFSRSLAVGPEIAVSVFQYKLSTAGIVVGYFFPLRSLQGGTSQFEVKTSYQHLSLTGFYDFRWRFLIASLRVGASFSIIEREVILREVSTIVVDANHLEFVEGKVIEHNKMTGVDTGFLSGICFGVDIADWIRPKSAKRRFKLSVLAAGNYERRGATDMFMAGGAIVFWPGGLFRNTDV